jgi:hypothetical protein
MLFIRSIIFTILVPGLVTIYIPYLIVTSWSPVAAGDGAPMAMLELIGSEFKKKVESALTASRESSIREILWKAPASSTPPSVARKWRCGWKL